MAADDLSVLTKIAITKLTSIKPNGWDTDAFDLYKAMAGTSHSHVDEAVINGAWRDAMVYMRENHRDDYDAYAKIKNRPQDLTSVPWEKVVLIKGQADGDTFELFFEVDGEKCVIECTDTQLLDPLYIRRKLMMYTRKDVNCPYTGKKQLEAWQRDVVLPWLKSEAFKHIERETLGETITNLIQEYCTNTLASETGPEAWMQQKMAVLDAGVVFVPFAGLQEFIGKRAGNELSKRSVKNILSRLGFSVAMKGKNRLRFHSITIEKLYAEADPGEAGGGEEHADRPDSGGNPDERRHRVLDELRPEERTRSAPESGEWPPTSETQSGTPDVPHDPFPAVQDD